MNELLPELLDAAHFYQPQILAGLVIAPVCAAFGFFLLLQRQVLFGATMSEAAALAFTLGAHLFPETGGQSGLLATFVIQGCLMAPFLILRYRSSGNSEAVLLGGLVVFAATTQILTVIFGAQTHLLVAYFGNILTTGADDLRLAVWVGGVALGVWLLLYRPWLAILFDRDHARLAGYPVIVLELCFFVLLTVVCAVSLKLMGAFFSLAQLVLPALTGLGLARGHRAAALIAMSAAALATLMGFAISVTPLDLPAVFEAEPVNLPTSSGIIVCLGVFAVAAYLIKIARGRGRA
jgi:ABC-type Mn2+/Zn2+ transport system permease subunit